MMKAASYALIGAVLAAGAIDAGAKGMDYSLDNRLANQAAVSTNITEIYSMGLEALALSRRGRDTSRDRESFPSRRDHEAEKTALKAIIDDSLKYARVSDGGRAVVDEEGIAEAREKFKEGMAGRSEAEQAYAMKKLREGVQKLEEAAEGSVYARAKAESAYRVLFGESYEQKVEDQKDRTERRKNSARNAVLNYGPIAIFIGILGGLYLMIRKGR